MSTKVSRVGTICCRLADARQRIEPRIGHRDLADVRLDGAERIVRRLRGRGLRERIEERRLADIRHADDAAFEAHDSSLAVSRAGFARLVVGLAKALGVHGEMHLVLEACVLAARQQLGVVGDDVGQRLDPVALALGEIAQHVGCTSSLTPGWPMPIRTRR